jgi:hypothetical protein
MKALEAPESAKADARQVNTDRSIVSGSLGSDAWDDAATDIIQKKLVD